MRKKKNPAGAAVLGFIFGPLGLFYLGAGHAAVSLVVTLLAIGIASQPGEGGFGPVIWSLVNGIWGFLGAIDSNTKIAVEEQVAAAARVAAATREREEEEAAERAAAAACEEEEAARAAAAARWSQAPVQIFPTQPIYTAVPMPVAPAPATVSGQFCASCGAWVVQSAKFCGECGNPVT